MALNKSIESNLENLVARASMERKTLNDYDDGDLILKLN